MSQEAPIALQIYQNFNCYDFSYYDFNCYIFNNENFHYYDFSYYDFKLLNFLPLLQPKSHSTPLPHPTSPTPTYYSYSQ